MTVSTLPSTDKLPVPVLEHPHWRVNFRPSTYTADRLETLSECIDVLKKTRVRLRGWDFPHIPTQAAELGSGDSWVAGWSDFKGHIEYWRFYQSTQFLYLGAVREVTEVDWSRKLRQVMGSHSDDAVVNSVPGFLNLTNSIYNITEYFELATRLAQARVYLEPVTITISIKGIGGFMLAADFDRSWVSDFVSRRGELEYSITLAPNDLISSSADQAMKCILSFFERFGWERPNVDVIRTDQQKLLTHQL